MKDTAFFCPACGTSSVKASALSGGAASCDVCAWTGIREELLNVPFEHAFDNQEEMVTRFVNQLASTIAKTSAQEVGKVLLQWGFLDDKSSPTELTSDLKVYIKTMAIAATKAVIETRQHIERVRVKAVDNDN
jgi:uncharacterized Zn finger protein (UPF0148 family)